MWVCPVTVLLGDVYSDQLVFMCHPVVVWVGVPDQCSWFPWLVRGVVVKVIPLRFPCGSVMVTPHWLLVAVVVLAGVSSVWV